MIVKPLFVLKTTKNVSFVSIIIKLPFDFVCLLDCHDTFDSKKLLDLNDSPK